MKGDKSMKYEEKPYHMNEPKVVAITGNSGFIYRIYTLNGGQEISAVYSPPGGIGIFGKMNHETPKGIAFWEIYSSGELFEDVERYATETEMVARLEELEVEGS